MKIPLFTLSLVSTLMQAALLSIAPSAYGGEKNADTLHIAVAANFANTLKELLAAFRKTYDAELKTSISTASTGTLFHQITQGAPFDIYFAADEARPRALLAKGFGDSASLVSYAQGQLILLTKQPAITSSQGCATGATPQENTDAIQDRLSRSEHIVIAHPDTAPYGTAAMAVISDFQTSGAKNSGDIQIIRARNVMHAHQLFDISDADAAFISRAQYLQQLDNIESANYHSCIVSTALHHPIAQFALALTDSRASNDSPRVANALLDFVRTTDARGIIARAGYINPSKVNGSDTGQDRLKHVN